MIRYKVNGKTIERARYGGERDRVLSDLGTKPWQTQKELSANSQQLDRMRKAGTIKRREGNRKSNSYEYALADATE